MLFPPRWPSISIVTMNGMPDSTRNGRLPMVSITNDQRLKSGMTRNRHVPFGSGGRKSNLPTDHTKGKGYVHRYRTEHRYFQRRYRYRILSGRPGTGSHPGGWRALLPGIWAEQSAGGDAFTALYGGDLRSSWPGRKWRHLAVRCRAGSRRSRSPHRSGGWNSLCGWPILRVRAGDRSRESPPRHYETGII